MAAGGVTSRVLAGLVETDYVGWGFGRAADAVSVESDMIVARLLLKP